MLVEISTVWCYKKYLNYYEKFSHEISDRWNKKQEKMLTSVAPKL